MTDLTVSNDTNDRQNTQPTNSTLQDPSWQVNSRSAYHGIPPSLWSEKTEWGVKESQFVSHRRNPYWRSTVPSELV